MSTDAMLICPRCRNAEYISSKFVGKKFFCHKCGNLAVVVDAQNLKKFDLEKLNIKVEDNEAKEKKYLLANERNPIESDGKEALSKKYKETIISEVGTADIETVEKAVEKKPVIEKKPFPFTDVFIYKFINFIYVGLQHNTQPAFVNDLISFSIRCSQYIILLLSIFLFFASCIFAWRSANYAILLAPLGVSVFLFTALYFTINALEIVHEFKGRVFNKYSSDVIPRSFFIAAILSMLTILFVAIDHMTKFSEINLSFFSISSGYSLAIAVVLVLFVLWVLVMCYAHPEEVLEFEKVDDERISVQFLSACALLISSVTRIAPVLFFAATLYVGALLVYDCGVSIYNTKILTYPFLENKMIWFIGISLFIPLIITYLAFLGYFVIDLCYSYLERASESQRKL